MFWDDDIQTNIDRIDLSIQDFGASLHNLINDLCDVYSDQPCKEYYRAVAAISGWYSDTEYLISQLKQWAEGSGSALAACKKLKAGSFSENFAREMQIKIIKAAEEKLPAKLCADSMDWDAAENYAINVIKDRCDGILFEFKEAIERADYTAELDMLSADNMALKPYSTAYKIITDFIFKFQKRAFKSIANWYEEAVVKQNNISAEDPITPNGNKSQEKEKIPSSITRRDLNAFFRKHCKRPCHCA